MEQWNRNKGRKPSLNAYVQINEKVVKIQNGQNALAIIIYYFSQVNGQRKIEGDSIQNRERIAKPLNFHNLTCHAAQYFLSVFHGQ